MGVDVLVIGRGEHLRRHVPLEVGHLLRPLVDEQRNQFHLRVVVLDAEGDILQQNGLSRLRRRDDQPARPVANGTEEIDQPAGGGAAGVFQFDPRLRIQRRQLLEGLAVGVLLGREALDLKDFLHDRPTGVLVPAAATARLLPDDVDGDTLSLSQAVAIAQGQRDEWIVLVLQEPIIELSDSTLDAVAPLEDPTQGGHTRLFECRRRDGLRPKHSPFATTQAARAENLRISN